ncbi:MAG: hypothetical protein GF346_04935 [Candidatus Eisenbacteria bacterium]|nr:hypothetical protein [Candidatus Latescibacterota bacterium]MBD3301771.1 hypothetical protein [Candidatus Eisenbacteria bacterium]
MRLGLALGSGGARGLAHVGVLSVLEREGLEPACITGTSMGAIAGALYADRRDAEEVAALVRSYTVDPRFQSIWEPFLEEIETTEPGGFFQDLRRAIHRRILTFRAFTSPSQTGSDHLLEPLGRLYTVRRIEELKLPFAAIAVDLRSGEPRVFTRGDLVEAVYASSAIPGIFPPLAAGSDLLIDGGGPYRVPVGFCRDLGADLVVAVDIPSFASEREEYERGVDIMMRMYEIAMDRLNGLVLRDADLVVRPAVERFHWAHFREFDAIREAGEAAMRDALPELRRLLRERTRVGARLRRTIGRLVGR